MLLTSDNYAEIFTSELKTSVASCWITQFAIQHPTGHSSTPFKSFWNTLHAAPSHLNDCRLIISSTPSKINTSPVNWSAIRSLAAAGWQVRILTPSKTLHAKTALFDRSRLIIGSHNWTQSALFNNLEASLLTSEHRHVIPWTTVFLSTWNQANAYCDPHSSP